MKYLIKLIDEEGMVVARAVGKRNCYSMGINFQSWKMKIASIAAAHIVLIAKNIVLYTPKFVKSYRSHVFVHNK